MISSIDSIAEFMVWPMGCDYYFYLKIYAAIFIILVWGLYAVEKRINQKAEILSVPGVGFGPSGEGFVRLSAFGSREDIHEAAKRISHLT